MCGIVGYAGSRDAVPILMERLANLAYRGYDSAGIAIKNGGEISIEKTPGKIDKLIELLKNEHPEGTLGLGHTRWATHGAPTYVNAHPHTDCTGKLVLIQNGIIENYLTLKRELLESGHEFVSQTDTEVLAHLVEEYYEGDLKSAVKRALNRLKGSFAVVLMHEDHDELVCGRMNAPLIVGLGDGENFIASDVPALIRDTNKFYILQNGDIVSVERDFIEVDTFLSGVSVSSNNRHLSIIDWDVDEISRGDYEHFMLKEIKEQPKAIEDTLKGRIVQDGGIELDLRITDEHLRSIKNIHLIACGTAYHACLYGSYILEEMLEIPADAEIASEFRYRSPIINESDLVIFVSQSGETADTLSCLDLAQRKGASTLAITNVRGSSITRRADGVMFTFAGPEIAVASTKAFTTQMVALLLFSLYLAQIKGIEPKVNIEKLINSLVNLPTHLEEVLSKDYDYYQIAQEIKDDEHCYFIGRNIDEPISKEGALKLKEISYIHAEAYPAGELKHGTIALIDVNTPVFAVITQETVMEKTISNVQEVIARDGRVYSITCEGNEEVEEFSKDVIYLPEAHRYTLPILATVPLQMISYHTAVLRGCDVDMPRNLAKSVTVE